MGVYAAEELRDVGFQDVRRNRNLSDAAATVSESAGMTTGRSAPSSARRGRLAAADRGTSAALAGMRALIEIADGTSSRAKTELDELTKMAPDLIPTWVDDLHAWQVAQPHAAPITSSMPGGGKVGRNEPCPCGSGRKYKKCCGAN